MVLACNQVHSNSRIEEVHVADLSWMAQTGGVAALFVSPVCGCCCVRGAGIGLAKAAIVCSAMQAMLENNISSLKTSLYPRPPAVLPRCRPFSACCPHLMQTVANCSHVTCKKLAMQLSLHNAQSSAMTVPCKPALWSKDIRPDANDSDMSGEFAG